MTQDPTYVIPGDQPVARTVVQPVVQPGVQPGVQSVIQPGTQRVVRQINFGRLWAGGAATAVVAALIVVVGVLVARQVLGTSALSSTTTGRYADGTITKYALLAAAAALLATVLMNLLLLAVPQPARFFSWIVGLLTAVVTILPFTMVGSTGPKFASALINLLVGIAILALLGSIAVGSVRRPVAVNVGPGPTVY